MVFTRHTQRFYLAQVAGEFAGQLLEQGIPFLNERQVLLSEMAKHLALHLLQQLLVADLEGIDD